MKEKEEKRKLKGRGGINGGRVTIKRKKKKTIVTN